MNPRAYKHAYLIIAHTNFAQLQTLLGLLDDVRNDIYLHIDKKTKDFSPDLVHTEHARLILIDRMKVYWGGHSQIQCELALLKAAVPGHYRYYHLLSGIDLPLKTQDCIHQFFQEHDGKEFMEFDANANESQAFTFRVDYYHPLQNFAGSSPRFFNRVLRVLNTGIMQLQKMLHFTRKPIVPLYKGANWFSITDDLAQYVLSQEDVIRKQFFHTWCADEIFLQSLAMASPQRENIVNNCLRSIDWQRGDPYTYRKEDVPELLASSNLWGRKFQSSVDPDAIQLVVAALINNPS